MEKNETLIQKIRNSNVEGPFEIDIKDSFSFPKKKLGSPPLLKRWRKDIGKQLLSTQDLANYLDKRYLRKDLFSQSGIARGGYHWMVIGEKKGRKNSRILKIWDVPHPGSNAVRYNLPDHYLWLRIIPSF